MTLDDRALREHLDRRAEAGAGDPQAIADAVVTRVGELEAGPWWRRLRVQAPSLGLAAAAVAVLIVVLAVLPPRIWGPGASPTASRPTVAAGYPANRPLTPGELRTVLAGDTSRLAGTVLIAEVELREATVSCPWLVLCATFAIDFGDPASPIWVMDADGDASVGVGTYALRVLGESTVSVVGRVRPGPDGLAWTLPRFIDELSVIRGPGVRPVPYLYLVDAVRVVWTASNLCPEPRPTGALPQFECGAGDPAWLVPTGALLPAAFPRAPVDSLRVPNVHGIGDRSGPIEQHEVWLVDPLFNVLDQDEMPPGADFTSCYLCPPAGSVDLIGRVATVDELGLEPLASTARPVDAYPADHPLTGQELWDFLEVDPQVHAGAILIADVELSPLRIFCYGTDCPFAEIRVPGRAEALTVWAPGPQLLGEGSFAFRVRGLGDLDLLGRVRAGPDGLAWTLPLLTAELETLRGPGVDPVPLLYLVDAWRGVSTAAYRCRATITVSDPDFGCGSAAWLVADEASVPTTFYNAPPGSLRLPNVETNRPDLADLEEHAFWLVDPFVPQEDCFLCPAAGAADLVGRVPTLEEAETTTFQTPYPSLDPTQVPPAPSS